MARKTGWIGLIVVLLVALLAVPAATAQAPVPETAGGALPPSAAAPSAGPRPAQDGGLLYLTSLDVGDGTFAVYDPGTDTWTDLAYYDTGAQMAVSGAGQLYAYGRATGTINLYDPATDTWSAVLPTPPGTTGVQGNLEITNEGEFLYTEWDSANLWYTSGGAWNSMALPFTGNAMGDYDPTTDQYVVGEAWTTNAHLIDVHTWAITDYYSPVPNGENARFSSVLDNRYFFEAGGSNIHSFDLANPADPPFDHGVSGPWYGSSAADRANHEVYVADLRRRPALGVQPCRGVLHPLDPAMAGSGTPAWPSPPPPNRRPCTWPTSGAALSWIRLAGSYSACGSRSTTATGQRWGVWRSTARSGGPPAVR